MDKKAVILGSLFVVVVVFIITVVYMVLSNSLHGKDISTTDKFMIELAKNEITVELGEKSPNLKNFVLDEGFRNEVMIDGSVDVSKVGKYEINYAVKRIDNTFTALLIVNVKDTIKPKVEFKDVEIVAGQTVEPTQFIVEIKDLSPTTTNFSEQLPDISKEGKFNLKIVVADKYGNKTEEKVLLTVKKAEDGSPENKQEDPSKVEAPTSSVENPNSNPHNAPNVPPTTPQESKPVVKEEEPPIVIEVPQEAVVGDTGTVASSISQSYPNMVRDGSLDAMAQACALDSANSGTIGCNVNGAHGKQGKVLSLLTNFSLSKSSFGVGVAVKNGINYIIVIEK